MFCCLRMCLNGNLQKPSSALNRAREPEIQLDATNMGPDVVLLSNCMRITGSGGALATAPLVQSKSYFEVKIQQNGCWSVGLATRQTNLAKKYGGSDKESWCLCSDNSTRHNAEEFRPILMQSQAPVKQRSSYVNGNETATAAAGNHALISDSAAAAGLLAMEDLADDVLLTTGKVAAATTTTTEEQHDFPNKEGDVIGVAFDHVELNFYFNGKNLEVPFRNVKGNVYPVLHVANGAILDIILDNFQHAPPAGFAKIMLEQSLL